MEIEIKGDIIGNNSRFAYDYFDIQYCCPQKVVDAINLANGEDLEVYINSGGGEISAGSEIYSALQAYTGNVHIYVVGQACSAASVIACAGHCEMAKTALMMIHNVSSFEQGDYRDMQHMADVLKTANETASAAYCAKTGMPKEQVLKLMDEETWLTAERALDLKMVDGIMQNQNKNNVQQLVASVGNGLTITNKTMDKLSNLIRAPASASGQKSTAQAKLNLLKLTRKED